MSIVLAYKLRHQRVKTIWRKILENWTLSWWKYFFCYALMIVRFTIDIVREECEPAPFWLANAVRFHIMPGLHCSKSRVRLDFFVGRACDFSIRSPLRQSSDKAFLSANVSLNTALFESDDIITSHKKLCKYDTAKKTTTFCVKHLAKDGCV